MTAHEVRTPRSDISLTRFQLSSPPLRAKKLVFKRPMNFICSQDKNGDERIYLLWPFLFLAKIRLSFHPLNYASEMHYLRLRSS